MGLLAFKERSPNDKTPFKKNEWHVGKRDSPVETLDAVAATTRSPIRRADALEHHRATERRRRSVRYASDRNDSAMRQRQRQLERLAELVAARHHEPRPRPADTLPTTTNFAPARDYWQWQPEVEERANGYMHASDRSPPDRLPESSTGTPRELSPGRIASPETEAAILRDLQNPTNQQDNYRLYIVGEDGPGSTPRMTITRASATGDRRRSLSPLSTLSDPEENWSNLMRIIPDQDGNEPSAGSSFASDSASSILSRSRPLSSVTNTTVDSRAASTEARSSETIANCPENDISLTRYASVSTLAPVRYSSAPVTDGRPTEQSNAEDPRAGRRLDAMDELMDMIDNGMEVPAEMWATIGVSPHLGLRGGAGRLRRINERL